MSDEYRKMITHGIQGAKCGVPSFVRQLPSIPARKPLPDGPLSLEEKQRFVAELIETAKLGARRDRNNLAYDFLSRDGILVECDGPFSARINTRKDDDVSESAISLLIAYLGEPSEISTREEEFRACAVALRKMEFMLAQNAAMSFGMAIDPDEMQPARLIGIDRRFTVFFDSD